VKFLKFLAVVFVLFVCAVVIIPVGIYFMLKDLRHGTKNFVDLDKWPWVKGWTKD
jgi:hypothetical protein